MFIIQPLQNLFKGHSLRSCLFDYDGTLVERVYNSVPPESLCAVLQSLCRKIPLGICSARILPQALEKLKGLLGADFVALSPYWFLFLENGSAGYRFENGEFREFYRVKWPEMDFPYSDFEKSVQDFFADKVDYISATPSSFIFRPLNYDRLNADELLKRVDELEKLAGGFLDKSGGSEFLDLGNSGMGIIFSLKNGNKDYAIMEFGKLLGFEAPFRQVLAVGDRPLRNGNDRLFLDGKYGVPFTVGDFSEGSDYPFPVLDEDGKRLIGPAGTEFLLKKLFDV